MRQVIAAKDKLIKKYEFYLEKYRGEARKSRSEMFEMEAHVRKLEA
jgi:hypothetical protein